MQNVVYRTDPYSRAGFVPAGRRRV